MNIAPESHRTGVCCRTRAKDAINPMTTQRTQQKKRKPHRGPVCKYTRHVHRQMVPMILSKMGFRTTYRTNIVSLTRIKLRQIIQIDCCFYGTVRCVFYNSAFDHSKLTTASSPIPATSSFKPGGTMILMQGLCISRLILSGHDKMGR